MRAKKYKSKHWSDVSLDLHWLLEDLRKDFKQPKMYYGVVKIKYYKSVLKAFKGVNMIYVLVHKNKFVYVGYTKNIFSRIYSHTLSNKDFTEIYYFLAPDEATARKMETRTIFKLQPDHNVLGLQNSHTAQTK